MPLPQRKQPVPSVPQPAKRPEIVPPRERPGRGRKWLLAGLIAAAAGAGIWWQLQTGTGFGGGGGATATTLPTVTAERGKLQRTLRLTGSTTAEKYVSIISPRLRGSRSRRGATANGTVGVKSNITVNSSSSVAPVSTMSSLSQTGLVSSSNSAASRGGGVSGGGGGGATSSRLQAATSRVGGGGSSGGNIRSAPVASANAMGSSGLGSTAANLPGGSSGPPSGGRRRGDFHLALQKLVPAGTLVRKGDVIAEFDRQYMETRLDDYRASVAQQQASYEMSKADVLVSRRAHDESVKSAAAALEKAKLDVKTTPVLSAIQAERTRLALEEAKAEYEQLLSEVPYQRISEEADLQTTKLDVQEAKLELKRASTNVNRLLVKAPMDGMVVLLDVFRNGQMGRVQEGDELWSGQPFIRVVDTNSMVVDAKVNQVDVEKLRIGQKARVTFDAFPDLELPAQVYSIGTVAKARQYRREFVTEIPVTLRLLKLDKRVIPDLTVAADVIVEEAGAQIRAPRSAIFTDEGDGTKYVFVKTSSGWERRDVELGLRNNLWVAIRSGVREGEEIAMGRPPANAGSRRD